MKYRLTALAAAALIIALVLLSLPEHEPGAPAVAVPLHDPGYSAQQARLVQTGPDGQPVYTLEAATIQQRPDAGLVDLEQVQLVFRSADGGVWTARARRGELEQNSATLQLEGDVHVAGDLPGGGDAAELLAEHLTIDTHSQIVSTRDPVTLVSAGRELAGTGMVASLKEQRVQLESAVHGSFLP